jgi:hypothetical protein
LALITEDPLRVKQRLERPVVQPGTN